MLYSYKYYETGVFFDIHNADSLLETIERFDSMTFEYDKVRKNAERFSISKFEKQFNNFVEKVINLKE